MAKIINTDNKTYWNIQSTISDEIIVEFDNEKDLILYMAKEEEYNGKLNAIKTLIIYPSRFLINDSKQKDILKENEYFNWYNDLILNTETTTEYYDKIDNKLKELLETLNKK